MRRRPAVVTALASLALAACSSSAVVAGHPDTSAPAHGTVITCVTTATLTSAQRAAATRVLLARADAAGTRSAAISASGPHTLSVIQPGFDRANAAQFCRTGSLQFRPLLAAPKADAGSSCAASGNSAAPQETACSSDGRSNYMLGPVVVDNSGIVTARGATTYGQPVVDITLSARAGAAWAAWTQAHNTGNAQASPAEQCGPATTPCADFVAFVLDGVVLTAPVTSGPITGGRIEVSGAFSAATTTVLAAQFQAGMLPAPFRLQSVSSR